MNYDGVYAKLQRILSDADKSFFANTSTDSNTRIWMVEGEGFRSYTDLSPERQSEIDDYILNKEETIRRKILGDYELADFADDILNAPSTSEIFARFRHGELVDVILAQWGCKDYRRKDTYNPITVAIERARKGIVDPVAIKVKYEHGEIAKNADLLFEYDTNRARSCETDNQGVFNFGRARVGSSITIKTPDERASATVYVDEGKNDYELTMALFTDVEIRVVNLKGEPVPNVEIKWDYLEDDKFFRTNGEGKIYHDDVEYTNEPFTLSYKDQTKDYYLDKENNEIDFQIDDSVSTDCIITVVDENGVSVENYTINAEYQEENTTYNSDSSGKIYLRNLKAGEELKITDSRDSDNYETYTLTEEDNQYDFTVYLPKKPTVSFQFLTHDKEPVPDLKIITESSKTTYDRFTNKDGKVFFDPGSFIDGEKLKVHIPYKKGDKQKLIKKSVKYSYDKNEYVFTLRKKRNWWWLLLLLLPLFLLFSGSKTIQIQALHAESEEAISGVNVEMTYEKHSLFSKETISRSGRTGESGVVEFTSLPYTFYSAIFRRGTSMDIKATSDCLIQEENKNYRFHSFGGTKQVIVPMGSLPASGGIRVIDAETGVQIENAVLSLTYHDAGLTTDIHQELKTNSLGMAFFNDLPKCGIVTSAKASAAGYDSGELKDVEVRRLSLISDEAQRTIRLNPR